MREIKFRGKSDDDWVYGMLIKINPNDCGEHGEFKDNKYMIQSDELEMGEYNKYFITDDNSIGQYTGLHDKNGKEIYEGDIVKSFFVDTDEAGNEIYKYYIMEVKYDEVLCSYKIDKFMNLEVIGNIYDNPELLKK